MLNLLFSLLIPTLLCERYFLVLLIINNEMGLWTQHYFERESGRVWWGHIEIYKPVITLEVIIRSAWLHWQVDPFVHYGKND